jgi:hypothetical protein
VNTLLDSRSPARHRSSLILWASDQRQVDARQDYMGNGRRAGGIEPGVAAVLGADAVIAHRQQRGAERGLAAALYDICVYSACETCAIVAQWGMPAG